ncbi:hypothetical protein OIU84_015872 [Salix udensis]|uniref:Uncharacterized protein n=1 Tax=Salix udensis TaxID=889485 RepID=A0AAD6J7W3_9ROSI|nr:hypothetical protein OIU84_015872 [Salix udensis]
MNQHLTLVEKTCNEIVIGIPEELETTFRKEETGYCKATYDSPFLDLSCHYFENYGKSKTLQYYKPLHFTDLVRYFLSSKHPKLEPPDGKQFKPHFTERVRNCLRSKKPPDGKQIKNPYSATMLHQAGIKFKPNLQAECLLDIRAWAGNENPVKKGELHMPQLEIDNCTVNLWRSSSINFAWK